MLVLNRYFRIYQFSLLIFHLSPSLFSFINESVQTIATNKKTRLPAIIAAYAKTSPAFLIDAIPKIIRNAENINPTNINALIIFI